MRTQRRLTALAVGSGVVLCSGLFAAGVSAGTASQAADTTIPVDTVETTVSPWPSLPQPVAPPADNDAEPQYYYGRIIIPKIDVDSPFIEGIRLSTLDNGPGHWPGTAMPGELGNVVVAGHRTSHNADFRRLDELEPGDEVIFDLDNDESIFGEQSAPTTSADGVPTTSADEAVPTTLDEFGMPPTPVIDPNAYSGVYVYEVVKVEIVPPTAMWIVTQDYRHEATLFACHPPGSVAERIVVFMDLKSPAPEPADPPRWPGFFGSTVPETLPGFSETTES